MQQIIRKYTFPSSPLMINLLNQICLLFEIHRKRKVMAPTLNKMLVIPFSCSSVWAVKVQQSFKMLSVAINLLTCSKGCSWLLRAKQK